MFNNTLVRIFSNPSSVNYLKTIYGNFQPYSKKIVFGDDLEIEITNRLFCNIDSLINKENYVEVDGEKYKIIDVKQWDDYLEVYLYKLKRQVHSV